MPNKTAIPDCIAEKIDFTKVRNQDELNTAIGQAYDACAKENKASCSCEKGEKKKREPSAYNLHISTCMKSKNIKGFGNAAPAMKECAAEWRKTHPKK